MGEHRVVLLARDGELPPPDPQSLGVNIKFIRVQGGYEAAAELLAQPALALLIDLPCLTSRHRKLLHVAKQLRVEVLGVGAFPPGLSASDLSGMRLISLDDLPTTLRTMIPRPAPATAPAPAASKPATQAGKSAPTAVSAAVQAVAAALKKEGVHLAPARKPEYKTSPQEPPRQSRIIAPAGSKNTNTTNPPSGKAEK